MKRICKFITIPITLFDTPDLSLSAKWCLLALDSITPQCGWVGVGVQGLSSLTNLPSKTVKEALTELHEHGAIEVSMQDGQKLIKPLPYKDAYLKVGERIAIGDKPSDAEQIDYDYIQEQWNSICTMLPKLDRLTPRRKTKIRTCLKGVGASVSDLIKVFRLVATSGFLNGSKSKEWSCGFDWVIKSPDNFTKIIEGQYHKDYSEKRDYETIMHGGEVNQQSQAADEYYR